MRTNDEYDENVDYSSLKQHRYDGDIYYECPVCGKEYLATFITEENGEVMCVECWDKEYGNSVDGDDEKVLSVYDAAEIWASHGKDEDYMFGYTEQELEDAL